MLLTIPNILSLLRLGVFLPAAYLAWLDAPEKRVAAAALLLFMAATDVADGYLARHLRQKSEIGRILDPLIDKICVGGMFLVLAFRGRVPWWLVSLVVGRDLLILLAGLVMLGRFRRVTESNWCGKAAVAVFISALIVYLLDLRILLRPALVLSVAAVVVSVSEYGWRFVRILAGKELPPPPVEPQLAGSPSVPAERTI